MSGIFVLEAELDIPKNETTYHLVSTTEINYGVIVFLSPTICCISEELKIYRNFLCSLD